MGFRETNDGTRTSLNLSTFLESILKQLDYVRECIYFCKLRLDFLFILEKYLFLGKHNLLSLLRLFDKSLSMAWLPCHFLMLLGKWCFSAELNLRTLALFFPWNNELQYKTPQKKSEVNYVALVLDGVSYINTANCFITLW